MTEQQITELFHRAADHYPGGGDAGSAADRAITGGRRRRAIRRGVVGVATLAVLGVAGTGVGLIGGHHSQSASGLIAATVTADPSASPDVTAAWPATLKDEQVLILPSGASATFYQLQIRRTNLQAGGSVVGGGLSAAGEKARRFIRPLPGGMLPGWDAAGDRLVAAYLHGESHLPANAGDLVASPDATAADFTALHHAYPHTVLAWSESTDVIGARTAAEQAENDAPSTHPVSVDLPSWTCIPITEPKDYGACSGPGGVTVGLSYAAVGTGAADDEASFHQIGSVPMMGGTGRILKDPGASPLQSSEGTSSGAVTGVQIDSPALADGVYVEVFAAGPGPWATLDDLKAVAGALTWK